MGGSTSSPLKFTRIVGRSVVWLEQPATLDGVWELHAIGDYTPDEVVGIAIADINGDGRIDVMTGGYSGGAETPIRTCAPNAASGRLAWFQESGQCVRGAVDSSRHLAPPPRNVRPVRSARYGRRRRYRLRVDAREQLGLRRRPLAGTSPHERPSHRSSRRVHKTARKCRFQRQGDSPRS